MLVLTRKNCESVVVGGLNGVDPLIKVTVLEIGFGKVRLGFDAPAEVPVHRMEVWERLLSGELKDIPPHIAREFENDVQPTGRAVELPEGQLDCRPAFMPMPASSGSRMIQKPLQTHVLSLFPPGPDTTSIHGQTDSSNMPFERGVNNEAV